MARKTRPFEYYVPALSNLGRQNRYQQAVTGRGLTPEQVSATAEGAIRGAAGQAAEDVYREKILSEDIRRTKRAERMQEKQLAAEKRAATVRGAVDVANLAITGYQLKKSPLFSSGAAVTSTPTAGATATTTAAPATGGGAVSAGAQTGAATSTGATTTTTATGGQAVTTTEAGTTATGGGGGIGPYAVPTAVGVTAGSFASKQGADKNASIFAAALAGGLTGAAYGAYGGPYTAAGGFAVGAVLGGLSYWYSSEGGGSVLCTELNRQGYLPDDVLYLDNLYRIMHIDEQTYSGYLRLATPIAEKMKKSKLLTWVLKPLIRGWAYEMASRINPCYKGSLIGKALFKLSPICKYFGEVKHATV